MLMYIAVHPQYFVRKIGEIMIAQKTTTLTLRLSPEFKEGLKAAAEQEHRSITNMVEVLIRDYCQQHNIVLSQENGSAAPSK